jgi:hypothetical protein
MSPAHFPCAMLLFFVSPFLLHLSSNAIVKSRRIQEILPWSKYLSVYLGEVIKRPDWDVKALDYKLQAGSGLTIGRRALLVEHVLGHEKRRK